MCIINVRAILVYNMTHQTDTAQKILDRAIEALDKEAGLYLKIEGREVRIANDRVDAIVQLEPGHKMLMVEVKKWAQQVSLGALINQIKELPGEGLLVADYVNPRMAGRLREQQVQFIDTVGNAYINQPPNYVYITGKRPEKNEFRPIKEGVNRAFEPTGLKVVYAFLRDPELVNAPYRKIAAQADVALGTVGWVLNGLKTAGYIRNKSGGKRRRLIQYRKLLNRWVEVWPEKLKPKPRMGEFIADDPYWRKTIDIQGYDAYWGGEIAAAKAAAAIQNGNPCTATSCRKAGV